MAKKVQLKDKSGNKAYPVTSSACVGMSDGSGSLDSRINKITTEYNVSLFHPTEGIDSTNKYTLETAIAKIPSSLRNVGIKCSFLDEAGKFETWECHGWNFGSTASWAKIDSSIVNSPTHIISQSNVLNLLSLNLVERIENRSFNSETGEIGEEGTSTTNMIIVNLVGINTTDIYFYNPFGRFNVNFIHIFCYDKDGYYIGSIEFDTSSSDDYVRHFIIPNGVTKFVALFITHESVYCQKFETCVPYGLTEREFNIRNSDFYRLGKTLDSVSLDLSNKFDYLKFEVFLKAGNRYRITSTYSSLNGGYLDVKGNLTQFTLGEVFIPQYDAYYLILNFVNTKDKEASLNIELVHEEIDLSDVKSIKELTNLKVGKLPFTIVGNPQKGTINAQNGDLTYSEDGTQFISEYVPIISTPMIYVTGYVNNIWFYDINKEYISHGTVIKAGMAYKSPEGACYMVFQRPTLGITTFGCVSTEEEYDALDVSTIQSLQRGDKTRFTVPNTGLRNKTVYVIGDSEAARFTLYMGSKLDSLMYCTVASSFGGHSDDFISSNIGIPTNGYGSALKSLKGAKVIVQSSTNGEDIPRLRAYILELIRGLRQYGANEIWGMSLSIGVNRTFDELKNNGKYQMQKILFGGHFIDHMAAVYQMGLYYNLYHPKAFTQPEVGGSVDIYFDDIKPFIDFTSNPIFAEGLDFYMQYYDDKYDIYTVVSVDEGNDKITATLKTNNSGIAPGGTAGQYEEEVTTDVWNGEKVTKGFIYNENDKNNVDQGKLPYNIYPDHTIHFGLILGAIMREMLYASGVLEYEDDSAVAYLSH